jgi:hypothetical protein
MVATKHVPASVDVVFSVALSKEDADGGCDLQ